MKPPTLRVLATRRDIEIAHYADTTNNVVVGSRSRRFWREEAGSRRWRGAFPPRFTDAAGWSRLARRLARTDQCNLVPLERTIFACRGGVGYIFDPAANSLREVMQLRQSRNPMSIAERPEGGLVFGEYGANKHARGVPIWACGPDGNDFEIVHEIAAGRARHVHGVFRDPYTARFWIATGDFDGECWLISVDPAFRHFEYHGDGSQIWRAVTVFFLPDSVVWLTDSQLEQNHVVRFDRTNGSIERLAPIPSPAWYGRQLDDRVFLAGCAWEHGPGCQGSSATLLASADGLDWRPVKGWTKDRWPAPWFKNGVIRFAAGPQTSKNFVLCGEGLDGLDGVTLSCSLEGLA